MFYIIMTGKVSVIIPASDDELIDEDTPYEDIQENIDHSPDGKSKSLFNFKF